MTDQLRNIPTDLLVDPWVLLRPVKKGSIEYLEMKTSIGEIGLLNSVSVRPSIRKPGKYEVIDGMYRTSCIRDLLLPEVPCIIKNDITDLQVLALQISANAIRKGTTPTQYARQLKKIQKATPGLTIRQLSSMVNKNTYWVRDQLGLLKLSQELQLSVDRGEIRLGNAYALARLPPILREQFAEHAKVMTSKVFGALSAAALKSFKEAVKHGKMEAFYESEFKPVPHLRSLKDIQAELESPVAAGLTLAVAECTTAMEGWCEALRWASHSDSQSVGEQEHKARKRSRKQWGD